MKPAQFEIVKQHIPALEAFALRFTNDLDSAKDLVQETMVRAIRFYDRFEEGTNLKSWLFTIMRNNFINQFRKNQAAQTIISHTDELSYTMLLGSSTRNGSEDSFMMTDIRKALSHLPERLCIPFMRYVEGYRYSEIAEESDAPIGTVKTRIYQARHLLKKYLADYSVL